MADAFTLRSLGRSLASGVHSRSGVVLHYARGAACPLTITERILRFLEPVTVTTLCGSRIVPPFGVAGGGPGALGENLVEWPDGRLETLGGRDERQLPAGAAFIMRTPGGGGWG